MRTTLSTTLFTLLVTACTGSIDGGGGGDDQPPTDEVSVFVRDGNVPQPNVTVIFQTASDVLVSEVQTDATGHARASLPEGGTVSVVRLFPLPPPGETPRPAEVYTYVGVEPGDQLELGSTTPPEDAPVSAIVVKVPETAQGTVRVKTSCGEAEGEAPLVAVPVKGCGANLAVYAMDGGQGAFFKRVPYSSNIDVSTETLTQALSSSFSATNVPAGAEVVVEKKLVSEGWLVYSTGTKRIDQTVQNATVPVLPGVEQLLQIRVAANGRTQIVSDHRAFVQGPTLVDASVGMTSYITEQPTFELGTISWLEEGVAAPDVTLATVDVTRGGTDNPNNQYVRTIIAPHAGTSLRIPFLSGVGQIFNPIEGDSVGVSLGVVKVTGGYDTIRAKAFSKESLLDIVPMDMQLTLSYNGSSPQ